MEHTLHIAFVLGAVVLFHRQATDRSAWGPAWLPYLLLGPATATRYETLFVAAGMALWFATAPGEGRSWPQRPAAGPVRWSWPAASRLAAFGLFNELMGGGWNPQLGHGQGRPGHRRQAAARR